MESLSELLKIFTPILHVEELVIHEVAFISFVLQQEAQELMAKREEVWQYAIDLQLCQMSVILPVN